MRCATIDPGEERNSDRVVGSQSSRKVPRNAIAGPASATKKKNTMLTLHCVRRGGVHKEMEMFKLDVHDPLPKILDGDDIEEKMRQ